MIRAIAAAVLTLAAQNALAQSSNAGSYAWVTGVTLFLAAALILLVAWLIRRGTSSILPQSQIRLLAAHALGPRERIVAVQAFGRAFLVGHTPSQINLICELDAEDVAEMPPQPAPSEFAARIATLLRKDGK